MGKIRDIWNGENRSFVRFAVVATALFLVLAGFVLPNSLYRWARSKAELHRQNRQIEMYRKEIGEMDKKLNKLSHDKDTLEQFAREQYGFAAPGDDVYLLK